MTDPHESDWSDLDLLTRDEVEQRLRAEVAVVEAELARLGCSAADDGPAVALARRLEALKARLAQ